MKVENIITEVLDFGSSPVITRIEELKN